MIPKPNDTFLDSSRRYLSSAALFGTGTLTAVEYLSFENRSGVFLALCRLR